MFIVCTWLNISLASRKYHDSKREIYVNFLEHVFMGNQKARQRAAMELFSSSFPETNTEYKGQQVSGEKFFFEFTCDFDTLSTL